MDRPDKDAIRRAWEAYHGPVDDGDGDMYIPAAPPAYERGFVDGVEYAGERVMEENRALRGALQQVREWYERDGSVGGCSLMIEEAVEPYTKS